MTKSKWIGVGLALALGAAAPAFSQERKAPPSPDVPAEKYFRNIQVFKGVPSNEIDGAMDFMASSLGVRCGFCHVIDEKGPSPFWKDDKKEKRTARKMIAMVRAINSANFSGKALVTCATCHHGHSMPETMPPLLAEAPVPSHPAATGAPLPSLDALLGKALAAVGGPDAVGRIASVERLGNMTRADGHSYPIEVVQQAPGRYLRTLTHPGGVFTLALDGQTGWEGNGRRSEKLDAEDLARLRFDAAIVPAAQLKELYPILAVERAGVVDGRDAVTVLARTKDGTRERLAFDAESGLLLRRTTYRETILGTIEQETDYSDYRDVDGVKMPFAVRRHGPGADDRDAFTQIRANVPVAPGTFAMPAGEAPPRTPPPSPPR